MSRRDVKSGRSVAALEPLLVDPFGTMSECALNGREGVGRVRDLAPGVATPLRLLPVEPEIVCQLHFVRIEILITLLKG